MPKITWTSTGDDDFYPDDDALGRNDPGKHYTLQFEQMKDIIQVREKWLLGVFGEKVDIWLRILPSDPTFQPCSCRLNERGQAVKDCFICYGTGALGGYQKLTIDNLAIIRMDTSRNHISPIDHDGKRLVSNREVEAWENSRVLTGYDVSAAKWLMRFPMAPRYKELTDHGKDEKETVSNCWFFSPIRLDESDFLVRENGYRYKFIDVSDSTWRGFITHTQFTAQVVHPSDVIYKVGVRGASVANFETDSDLLIQEQLAEEIPNILGDTSIGEGFFDTFDFNSLFSYKRKGRKRFR
jgi:hypothetical protein